MDTRVLRNLRQSGFGSATGYAVDQGFLGIYCDGEATRPFDVVAGAAINALTVIMVLLTVAGPVGCELGRRRAARFAK